MLGVLENFAFVVSLILIGKFQVFLHLVHLSLSLFSPYDSWYFVTPGPPNWKQVEEFSGSLFSGFSSLADSLPDHPTALCGVSQETTAALNQATAATELKPRPPGVPVVSSPPFRSEACSSLWSYAASMAHGPSGGHFQSSFSQKGKLAAIHVCSETQSPAGLSLCPCSQLCVSSQRPESCTLLIRLLFFTILTLYVLVEGVEPKYTLNESFWLDL